MLHRIRRGCRAFPEMIPDRTYENIIQGCANPMARHPDPRKYQEGLLRKGPTASIPLTRYSTRRRLPKNLQQSGPAASIRTCHHINSRQLQQMSGREQPQPTLLTASNGKDYPKRISSILSLPQPEQAGNTYFPNIHVFQKDKTLVSILSQILSLARSLFLNSMHWPTDRSLNRLAGQKPVPGMDALPKSRCFRWMHWPEARAWDGYAGRQPSHPNLKTRWKP